MANPPKPWKVEYAKSGRSSCKTCKTQIDKEKLRLGKIVQSTQFDGFMPMWNHASCILKTANQIKSPDDVEGIELLRWEDQETIRKYVDGGGPQNTPAPAFTECGVGVSPSSRATCKHRNQKILKGQVRISTRPEGQGAKWLAWHHASCFMELFPATEVEKLTGWDSLSPADQAAVRALVVSSTAKGPKDELQEQSTSKGGAKRKREASNDSKPKIPKSEGDALRSRTTDDKNANNTKNEDSK